MRWWWKQLAAVCVSRMLCVESRVSEGNTPALRSESRRMERWNSWVQTDGIFAIRLGQIGRLGGEEPVGERHR